MGFTAYTLKNMNKKIHGNHKIEYSEKRDRMHESNALDKKKLGNL